MRAQVLPERYGGAARLVPVEEAVAAARAAAAGAECGERGEAEGAPAEADEGRLAAAKAALRRWASAGWSAVQRPLRVRSRPVGPRPHRGRAALHWLVCFFDIRLYSRCVWHVSGTCLLHCGHALIFGMQALLWPPCRAWQASGLTRAGIRGPSVTTDGWFDNTHPGPYGDACRRLRARGRCRR